MKYCCVLTSDVFTRYDEELSSQVYMVGSYYAVSRDNYEFLCRSYKCAYTLLLMQESPVDSLENSEDVVFSLSINESGVVGVYLLEREEYLDEVVEGVIWSEEFIVRPIKELVEGLTLGGRYGQLQERI